MVYWRKVWCLCGPLLEEAGDRTRSPQTEGPNLGVVEALARYERLVAGSGVEDLSVCSLLWWLCEYIPLPHP